MPTLLELARLASAVYDPRTAVAGWSWNGIERARGSLDGFQATSFVRGSELVIGMAIRVLERTENLSIAWLTPLTV